MHWVYIVVANGVSYIVNITNGVWDIVRGSYLSGQESDLSQTTKEDEVKLQEIIEIFNG
jgi:hypothetical protein